MKKKLLLTAFLLIITNFAFASPTTSYSGCNDQNQTITLSCHPDAYAGCTTDSPKYQIDNSGWQSYSAPFTLTTDGEHKIDYYSSDTLGNNETINTKYCKIDKTPPTTTASGCASGWNSIDKTVTLTCSPTSDCNATRYRINGGAFSGPLTFTADGNYTIEYDSNDHAGNRETTKTYYCLIDKSAPSVSLSATTSGHIVYLNWSASDTSGISNVVLYREGAFAGSILSSNSYPYPEPTDGTYYYKITATDNAGHDANSSEIFVPVSSSSTGSSSGSSSSGNPASIWITLSISSADFAKAGKFPIILNGDEPFEGGYQIKIKLPNSSTFKDIASAASYSGKSVTVEYEFKAGDDGNASIVAVAWSSSGSRAEKEKTITIDTKIPSIELLAPKTNETVSGTVELKANATDGNLNVKEVSFYYRKGSSGNWLPIPASATRNGNSWSGKWNTAGLSDAKYEFKAVASDAAGNKAEKIIELKISNIVVLGITGKAEVEKEALFSFKESDLNAMFNNVLANEALAKEAMEMAIDCNVSRILKIIKITDANKTTYKASVFISFRNNSKQNMSVQLVEVVPKDFAQSASAIESTEPFSIIESDPIIAWDLNNVPAGKAIEIVYSLKNSLAQEAAAKLADASITQKFSAPPILVSITSQLSKKDFVASLSSTPLTGFLGFIDNNLLAIILGLIIAGAIVSALFLVKSGFSFGSGNSFSGAKPIDWTYREAVHEKILDKISSGLNEFIGFNKGSQNGRKWIFKKEPATEPGEKKESGLKQLFGNLEFTIAKKTEKQKTQGKSKWAFKENADI